MCHDSDVLFKCIDMTEKWQGLRSSGTLGQGGSSFGLPYIVAAMKEMLGRG